MKPLSPRRARFVQEYLLDLNPRAAAVRAGYKADGYRFTGYALLREPEVADAIRAAQDARARRVEIEADQVVRALAAVAFGDIRRVASWRALPPAPGAMADESEPQPVRYEVSVRDSGDIDDATAMAIASLRHTNGGGVSIRLHDRLPALALLGRHLGLFRERSEAGTKAAEAESEAASMRRLTDEISALSPARRAAMKAAVKAAVSGPGPMTPERREIMRLEVHEAMHGPEPRP